MAKQKAPLHKPRRPARRGAQPEPAAANESTVASAATLDTPPAFPLRLEWRTPAELAENPANWRRHPVEQTEALTGVMTEVGWAGACLYNERTGRLVDGHARRKVPSRLLVDGKVPVLIGSWSEEQERKILATLDPIAGLAEADEGKLAELLAGVQTESAAVQALLDDLAGKEEERSTDPQDTSPQLGGLQFRVVIDCESEQQQTELIERLEQEGLTCRPLMS